MAAASFQVFGLDRQLYGPVVMATLLEWVRDGRIQRDTWIYSEASNAWNRADVLPELAPQFAPTVSEHSGSATMTAPAVSRSGVPAKALTRLRVFSSLAAEDLEPFSRLLVEESFRPFSFIVQQGAHGDAMYFVIQGKVGVSMKGQVSESFLVALGIGDTFGEMSLFDPGPRSADVRAENDVVVLKLTVEALQRVCNEAPVAANKFLWNVARMLSARIRSMDRRTATQKDLEAVGRVVT